MGAFVEVLRANGVIGLASAPAWTSAGPVEVARSRRRNDAVERAGGDDGKRAVASEPARSGAADFERDGAGALKIAGDCALGNPGAGTGAGNAGAGTGRNADAGTGRNAGAGTFWSAGARTSRPTATDVVGEKLARALRMAGVANGPKVGLTLGEEEGVDIREIVCGGEPETIGHGARRIFGDVPRPTVAVVVMAGIVGETLEIPGGATLMAWSKERARASGLGVPPPPGIKGALAITALRPLAVASAGSTNFDE